MPLMERLCDFLIDSISNQISTRSVAAVFTSEQVKTNDRTIGSYIKYLCNAFAFYKVRRYDIHGKRYLSSNDKYYLSDHSFKYAKLGTKNADYGRMIENIVAIELLRRGYELYAGVLYKKEIDFVAIKRSEKLYIQVAGSIDDPDTFQREVDPLLKIKDAYPKMILTRTRQEAYQYEGVQIVDVADWLVEGSMACCWRCPVWSGAAPSPGNPCTDRTFRDFSFSVHSPTVFTGFRSRNLLQYVVSNFPI